MGNQSQDGSWRLLEQYSTLEYILLGDLRDLLEDEETEENSKWLLAVLDALLDTLPREFRLEEEGGYMAEVLEEYPSWYPIVDRLQAEHRTLFSSLRQLRNQISRQASASGGLPGKQQASVFPLEANETGRRRRKPPRPVEGIADQVRCELRDWMNSLIAHNRHENRLLQTAVNLEVGIGD